MIANNRKFKEELTEVIEKISQDSVKHEGI
jgi:hypothetical protein